MNFQSLFQSTPSIEPEQVKQYLTLKKAEEYCLLDVRQPVEHAQGRLPGSVLIPLGELSSRASELNPDKMTIVYCRTGSRSTSATNYLRGLGFDKALNMTGGIVRYNGFVASGSPKAAMACFQENLSATQLTATAWVLEHGTIGFIEKLCHEVLDDKEPALFDKILEEKRAHQERLSSLAQEMKGGAEMVDFPAGLIEMPDEAVMVGCVRVSAALQWSRDKKMNDLLEMMMTLSANAYDFYLRLQRLTSSAEERRVFGLLATEEHQHLERLAKAYEREIPAT